LLPGNVEAVVGFQSFRAMVEGFTGPLSPTALASQIYGLYAGLVYFTPILGGMVADRWIGQRAAVVAGALLMCVGHAAMAFDESFLLALALLIAGSGLLKGNISAQVGALYPRDEEGMRSRGFTIFSLAINVGAVAGPLLCGYLGQVYGWHYGFTAAALFMGVGLAVYLSGYRHLPARVERGRGQAAKLGGAEWRAVAVLLLVMAATCFQSVVYMQGLNVALLWTERMIDLEVAGFSIPVPWFSSLDPAASVLCVPVLFWIWRRQAVGGRDPSDLSKIATGAAICVVTNLALVAATVLAGDGKANVGWALFYFIGQGVSFVYYWPTLLALVSRCAPAAVNGTMMGITYMTLFIANIIAGSIGTRFETMDGAAFWMLHAAIAAAGAVSALVLARLLPRELSPAR
ncbi:MAG TPA: MFS transporter, partial [Azospirillaceae bacterium]|nr:MFS transporter [Azospirillaceae bacterium]